MSRLGQSIDYYPNRIVPTPRPRTSGRTVGFEGILERAPNGNGRIAEERIWEVSNGRTCNEGNMEVNLPPLLAAHMGRTEARVLLQPPIALGYICNIPSVNQGGNSPPNGMYAPFQTQSYPHSLYPPINGQTNHPSYAYHYAPHFLHGSIKEQVYVCQPEGTTCVKAGTKGMPLRNVDDGEMTFFLGLQVNQSPGGCQDTFKSTLGRMQFLGEKLVRAVKKGTIDLYFVKTDYQLADMFTKALPQERFNYLVRRLGMRSLSPNELEHLAKSQ
ncbi:hypothetical protein Tco_0978227 [Tanacetum coccineum]|uniref:Retrovirus-related Pol polyprotein from transposon TNT 1-94 n=1 Tax=Tanacetum coccineum TaxID=301880 RepID=A0ABQ5EMG5_9ASTR